MKSDPSWPQGLPLGVTFMVIDEFFERFVDGYTRAISTVIPADIMAQAQGIVAAHRQEDIPIGAEPICMALKPKDHGFLNGLGHWIPLEERRGIYAEKRAEYLGDSVAQQQIDVYDGETVYHDKLHEYIDALRSGDTAKESELKTWFDTNYPDIK